MSTKNLTMLIYGLSILVSRLGIVGWALTLHYADNTTAYAYISSSLLAILCIAVTGAYVAAKHTLPFLTEAMQDAHKTHILSIASKMLPGITFGTCIGSAIGRIEELSDGEISSLLAIGILGTGFGAKIVWRAIRALVLFMSGSQIAK